jgi:hypothetical protein
MLGLDFGDRLLNPCCLSNVDLRLASQYPNRTSPGMPGSKDGFVDDLMAKLNQLF